MATIVTIMNKKDCLAGTVVLMLTLAAAGQARADKYVGVYAEAEEPDKPILTVKKVGEKLIVEVPKKGTFKAEQTPEGLVFVEDDKDRNVFRIRHDVKTGQRWLEHLGKATKNKLPTKAGHSKRIVRRAFAAAGDAKKAKIRLDETAGTFMCATGERLIWRVPELIESTRGHRAQSFIHRFYVQKRGDPAGRLIHVERDTRVNFLATVMGDGTFVLSSRGMILWRTPEGKSLPHPDRLRVMRLYEDGVELRTKDKFFFVPFKGPSLNMDAKVELGKDSVRHGDKFAWIAESTLHVYDLKSRKRTKVPLEVKLHPSWRVNAFDGQTAMAFFAFDVKTGRILGQKNYPKMPTHFAHIFAVRNRIGYLFREDELRATDLTSLTWRSVPLLATKQKPSHSHRNPPHFQDSEGIRVWNGKKWVLVKWLKEWPDSDSQEKKAGKATAPGGKK